jgi:hypothetical protein
MAKREVCREQAENYQVTGYTPMQEFGSFLLRVSMYYIPCGSVRFLSRLHAGFVMDYEMGSILLNKDITLYGTAFLPERSKKFMSSKEKRATCTSLVRGKIPQRKDERNAL